MGFDLNHRSQGAALDELYFISFVQIPVLLLEISINVPRVPLFRLVYKRLQQVATDRSFRASGIGFGRSKRFGPATLVEQAGHAAGLRMDLQADELVFESVCRCFQQGMRRRSTVG